MNRADHLELIGGHPALDFANTAGMHAGPDRHEWLVDYAEVLAWAGHAGVVDAAGLRVLRRAAAADRASADRAWRKVVSARETIYRIFAAVAQKSEPAGADLAALHRTRVLALQAGGLGWHGGATIEWITRADDMLRPLHPIAVAAADLLTSPRLVQVKQCGRHPCGWLFLDTSRNRSRRWCTSAECGNVVRVRRFRERRRGK